MGEGSYMAFPRGAVYGERWISIGAGALIGPHVSVAVGLPGESFDQDQPPIITIGERCMIGRGSSIVARCGISIEAEVTTGPNVYVTDHNHVYEDIDVPISRQWLSEGRVRVGYGSWLGAGVVVLAGSDIGRNVVVAANSVVRGTIPDNSVVAGAPAKVVRQHVDGVWEPPLRHAPIAAPEGWSDGYGRNG